jgi:hypothetical protein
MLEYLTVVAAGIGLAVLGILYSRITYLSGYNAGRRDYRDRL